jgi:uridine kinase
MSAKGRIIGICGGSGSGKTSVLNGIKEKLSGHSITYISMDDYYLPRDKQYTDENGIKNFDLPTAMDTQQLVQDLDTLESGQQVIKSQYTFNNAKAKESTITLYPAKVYIIEGLFIYHYAELKERFDLKIYVDASIDQKIIRRIKRDQTERNYPLEDVLYRYEHHVMPSYKAYIQKYKAEADLIINNYNTYDKGLDVLVNHLKTLTTQASIQP